jgi:outer membrane biosynthesis protein TonB
MTDKPLLTALAISAAIHSIIFLSISPRLFNQKQQDNIRISYMKGSRQIRPAVKKELIEIKDRLHNTEKLINDARIDTKEFARGQRQFTSSSGGTSEYMPKPLAMKDSFSAMKKKVTLPKLELNIKIRNPSYNGYYELIREKIRHAAYQNYSQTETGEVYIAFVVGKDGNLKEVRYIEDKSTPSYFLKDISLRSIKEAGPFPPFPDDLDYPQLSFNVIISFQFDE